MKNAEERPTKFATKLILSIQNLLLAFVRAEMATDDYHGNDTVMMMMATMMRLRMMM